jgi:dihydrofolate reductase
MRSIITTTFVTLDGVMQAPGGPDEDRTGGFACGGWVFPYWDDMMGKVMDGFMSRPFDLLLGRRTYDIFAAYWPQSTEEPIAGRFNRATKYVVSHGSPDLPWERSELITGQVVDQLQRLKQQEAPDLWVHGSGELIQTLLAHQLIDRMHLWTFPAVVGGGKRLFADESLAAAFKLSDSRVSTTGVIIATYEPAGPLQTGSFAQ